MTTGGWLMMIASWVAIIALNVFCIVKLLVEKPAKAITAEPPEAQ